MKALLSLLLLCSACAFGQRRIDVDNDVALQTGAFFQAVNGAPVVTNIYYKVVEGSAYFNPEWMKGSAALAKEKEYRNLWLKLDLLANQLHFRDDKGNEMICSTPLTRLTLGDSLHGGKVYHFAYSAFIPELFSLKPEAWMEVLAEGRASLYSQHKKIISEIRPYGSATMEQHIMTSDINYLVYNNQSIRVKRLSDIVSVLSDKKAELQQWIKNNNVEDRNPADMSRLVQAYNSMFPKS